MQKKNCEYCKKEFKPRTIISMYCSDKCFRLNRRKHIKFVTCITCGKILRSSNCEPRKYCSNKCQADYSFQQKIDETLKNEIIEHTHSQTARKIAFKIFGKQCSTCNRTTWMNEDIPLILDHVNGNSEDWSLKNMRLICPNCDAQTPTYTGRNRGNGRFLRRLRYLQEKKAFRDVAQAAEQLTDNQPMLVQVQTSLPVER